MADVGGRVAGVERLEVISPRHSLSYLPHVRSIQQVAQLRLADQNDLQQLLFRGLEVRQETHLLEQLG
jgi:hypothetical protein